MEVRDDKVQSLISMRGIVDKLAESRREEENVVWFVAVKVAHKDKPGFLVLHFQEMEV